MVQDRDIVNMKPYYKDTCDLSNNDHYYYYHRCKNVETKIKNVKNVKNVTKI